jgi:hypothetical protein
MVDDDLEMWDGGMNNDAASESGCRLLRLGDAFAARGHQCGAVEKCDESRAGSRANPRSEEGLYRQWRRR